MGKPRKRLCISLQQPRRQRNPAASCIPNLPPWGHHPQLLMYQPRGIVIVTSKTLCPIVGLAVPSSACNSGQRGSEPCPSADCNAWTCILVPPGPHSPPAPSPAGMISKFRVYPLMSWIAILLAKPAGFTRGVRKNQTLAPSALQ